MKSYLRRRDSRIHDQNPKLLEYVARVNRVLDHIDAHVDQPLSLDELARVAHFSPFHFHRIFSAFTGETLKQFIQRVRIERAASQLISNPRKSVTDVALDCGFSGSAAFARAFREAFGTSASQWRAGGWRKRKKRKTHRKIREDFAFSSGYFIDVNAELEAVRSRSGVEQEERGIVNNRQLDVTVKDIEPMTVAYVRHIGPYKADAALFEGLFARLMAWAGPRNLLDAPDKKILVVYHDNPSITDEDKLRISVCLSIQEGTQVEGEVGKMTIPGGRYAFARFELGPDEYAQAWSAVYGGWLPQSGYQPDDRPSFELYLSDCSQHPEKKAVLDICVPVKPL